jgi:hypothetical protein
MTDEERKELEALRKKADPTDDDKKRIEALEAKEKAAEGGDEKTFSESYVKELRTESAKYRTKAKEAEEALAKFDGIDLDEYHTMKQAQKDEETKELERKGEFDKLREQMVDDHNDEKAKWETEKAELNARYAALEAELHKTILSHEIVVAAAVAKAYNPKLVELAVAQMVKVEQGDDGRRIIRVLDAEGNPRKYYKTGEPMTIPQLLEEMKQSQEYAPLFAGGNVGAGSNTVQFDGKSIENPWKPETLNLTLQGKIVKENPELAARLKAEAGRA